MSQKRLYSPVQATIESLDQEGRGITHVDGKVIFVEGALIGEKAMVASYHKKPTYELAKVTQILKPSPNRVEPKCKHFGMCGGCAMQHLDFSAQVAAKQRVLEDNLWHIAKIKPESMLPPIYGPAWGYRHRARLRARYIPAKGRVLVGFNEKHSSFITEMQGCEVLPPHISDLIVPMQELVSKLSIRDAMPQVEVAVGDEVSVLVFRILEAINADDEALMHAFAEQHGVQVWVQSKGPETARLLAPGDAPELSYSLPEFDLVYPFMPTEFTQVNPYINRVMVRRAMKLLDPQAGERIADLFCGLGNFTLPIARSRATVLGMEGSASLVRRAEANAERNGLSGNTEFREADLFQMTAEDLAALGHFDKMLIDPPRDGAVEVVKALPDAESGLPRPSRIVYVSCNPATLARDAGVLVQVKGYRLTHCGVINMFPHTAHVESIAVFEH